MVIPAAHVMPEAYGRIYRTYKSLRFVKRGKCHLQNTLPGSAAGATHGNGVSTDLVNTRAIDWYWDNLGWNEYGRECSGIGQDDLRGECK